MTGNPYLLIKHGRPVDYHPPFSSLAEFLKKASQAHPHKPAIIFDDFLHQKTIAISYQDLERFTRALASTLFTQYGLTAGDRFAFAFDNTPEIILLNYAAWRVGLTTVPLDTARDTLERKIYKLKLTHSKLLFTRADATTGKENRLIQKALPKLTIVETKDFQQFQDKILSSKILNTTYDIQNADLGSDCLILFTSGTTALPKGVRLTLKSLWANAQSIVHWLKFDANERFHILLPLHHINSTTFVNATLSVGGTVILTPRYSKSKFFSTMAKHRATGASIVPTIAYDLLSETKAFKNLTAKLKSVRRLQIGSAPVQPTVVETFMKQYPIPLIQGYGQTETSLRSTGVPMDLKSNEFRRVRELNSLGAELAYTNLTILNDKGKELEAREVGELCVRGPAIMAGYLNDPQATDEAFAHGWFHSGDTGFFQRLYGRKFFFLTGRTKEIIKRGGVLISPVAIENTLLKHYPGLEFVYAVGFPHPRLGEDIGIVVSNRNPLILKKLETDINRQRVKGLKIYEFPQAVLPLAETRLPKTSTGKVQRLAIKTQFGTKLLELSRTIEHTPKLTFRLIGPEEKSPLKTAVAINNQRWGLKLKSTVEEFVARAQNGILIGALDRRGKLLGTVSGLILNHQDLEKPWAKTWRGVTGSGTLATHKHKGDSLLCVAISTKTKSSKRKAKNRLVKQKLTPMALQKYLESSLDPVINFHRQPKGGFKRGATIVRVLPKSRPEDTTSLGYNVLMRYPDPSKLQRSGAPSINPRATTGIQLIEAALMYAHEQRLKHVYVYTRPATLGKYFRP